MKPFIILLLMTSIKKMNRITEVSFVSDMGSGGEEGRWISISPGAEELGRCARTTDSTENTETKNKKPLARR
jgi:hypothetical protein